MSNLVPILFFLGLFAMIAAIVIMPQWLRRKEREAIMATITALAEKDRPFPADLLASLLAEQRPSREQDIRRGAILLAFWSATTIIGAMIGLGLNIGGVPNAFVAPLIGIAIGALPGCIGAVYLNFGLRAPKAG